MGDCGDMVRNKLGDAHALLTSINRNIQTVRHEGLKGKGRDKHCKPSQAPRNIGTPKNLEKKDVHIYLSSLKTFSYEWEP